MILVASGATIAMLVANRLARAGAHVRGAWVAYSIADCPDYSLETRLNTAVERHGGIESLLVSWDADELLGTRQLVRALSRTSPERFLKALQDHVRPSRQLALGRFLLECAAERTREW